MSDELLAGPLARFTTAVADLTGVRHLPHPAGGHYESASLYSEVAALVTDRPRGPRDRTRHPHSTPNIYIDALAWLQDVESEVALLWGHRFGDRACPPAAAALRILGEATWAPADADRLTHYARRLSRWIDEAEHLVNGRPHWEITAECPACGESAVWRQNAYGENVRLAALQLSTEACRCQACGTTWAATQFSLLAAVLGVPAPEGVVVS